MPSLLVISQQQENASATQRIISSLYNAQTAGYIRVKQSTDYLLYNAQTDRDIAVKQSNDYLLVIQCLASWIYWGETDQWLSACYTKAQPDGYIGVKQTNNYLLVIQCPTTWIYWGETDKTTIYLLYNPQPRWNSPTIIYLLYNAQPTGYIGVKWINDYLLVTQCPASWIYQGETVQGLSTGFTMPNLLVTSGWNRRLSTCLFNN